MEAHSPNGYQPHTSTINIRDQPRVALLSDARGLPTPEALSIVIRHAVRLLSSHAIGASSHIRLEQERKSSDPTVRGQIQTESVQAGLTMQHLGSLLLELGRSILTLRMGHSPAESSVNPGPAVDISPSGPIPIMVQPFPLQTESLFSGSQSPSNPLTVGPVGVGNIARHVNIHIHPGTTLAPVVSAVGNRTSNGEGMQGERGNNAGSVRVLPLRGAIAATDQPRATGAMSHAAQYTPTEASLSSGSELNSRIRNLVSMQGDTQAGSQQPNNIASIGAGDSTVVSTVVSLPANLEAEEPKSQPQHAEVSNNNTKSGESSKDASVGTVGYSPNSSGESMFKSEDSSGSVLKSSEDNAKPVPLGLGLGGLERKGRVKPTKSSSTASDSGAISSALDQNLTARATGQQILQSLASRSSSINRLDTSSVLQSPALNGLLAGVSEQTGVGSPVDFRNMLQQLTQSPQIMNTVSLLAQQVDSQDIGNMFSGFGGGQGGVDLSLMFQQMMPIVTQALGHGPSVRPPFPAVEPKLQDIEHTVQRIEQSNLPGNVFHAVVENAVQVYGNGRNAEELLIELCGNEGLVKEYTEMLQQDLRQRFQDKSEKDKSSS
ncbi:Ubiquitin-like superfamily protein, putative isoform 2 [Hibiscus syriacus]|uniref:Ubiquitin-like superfamily protein, putative isoform 2 n=1 Tax=Hibiscus syriacus TaxID=106335 RepID=A0A6A2YSL5_HIBSY|nr:Ubiquitin-like superfamily protein, putative isoform 2 [Hibiscus syriacus]